MKKILSGLFLFAGLFGLTAQNNERVLLNIGGDEITVDEFLSVYNKNRNVGEDIDPKSMDEYLDLFINFKLKVKEAETRGMDTIPSFVNELSGYRRQLAKPYLVDTNVEDVLVEEAYERMQDEIKASHILIKVGPNASPTDTLRAYKRMQRVSKELGKGMAFEAAVKKYSDDKYNDGNLGYFSAMYMVYPFETAAYNTKVGDLSEIIRTRFGYHLIKVTDKRKNRGERKVAHIMVKTPDGKDKSEASIADAKKKVDELYERIQGGEDFAELAKQFSDDKTSAVKGGTLPFFGSNKMVPEFENTAFALKNTDDVAAPIKTEYGWHIIKLKEVKPVGSFEELKESLKSRIQKDSRSQRKSVVLINKLKKEYNLKEYPREKRDFYKVINNDYFDGKFNVEKDAGHLKAVLFEFADRKVYQESFAYYLRNSYRKTTKTDSPIAVVDNLYKDFLNKSIIDYENEKLEEKYHEFNMLMTEYHDGILLYELTDELVWSKAVKDSLGLENFYEANKNNYMWPERADASIYTCANEKIAKKTRKYVARCGWTNDEITEKVNKKSQLNLDVESGVYLKGDNEWVDKAPWQIGDSDFFPIADDRVKFVYIHNIIQPEPKKLSEARGLITSDYQNYLESEWIKELRAKYKVDLNQALFRMAKQGRLADLDKVKVADVPAEPKIKSYKGHFEKAFGNAVKDLGSSKEIIFEWYGNMYTTEMKKLD